MNGNRAQGGMSWLNALTAACDKLVADGGEALLDEERDVIGQALVELGRATERFAPAPPGVWFALERVVEADSGLLQWLLEREAGFLEKALELSEEPPDPEELDDEQAALVTEAQASHERLAAMCLAVKDLMAGDAELRRPYETRLAQAALRLEPLRSALKAEAVDEAAEWEEEQQAAALFRSLHEGDRGAGVGGGAGWVEAAATHSGGQWVEAEPILWLGSGSALGVSTAYRCLYANDGRKDTLNAWEGAATECQPAPGRKWDLYYGAVDFDRPGGEPFSGCFVLAGYAAKGAPVTDVPRSMTVQCDGQPLAPLDSGTSAEGVPLLVIVPPAPCDLAVALGELGTVTLRFEKAAT